MPVPVPTVVLDPPPPLTPANQSQFPFLCTAFPLDSVLTITPPEPGATLPPTISPEAVE